MPGCACVHLPTMTPRVKPPHRLVSVLYWLLYCRATSFLSALLANLTLLLGENTLPFPAFGNLNLYLPRIEEHTSLSKSCPNKTFPHQQDFFPIRSVTKSSTARFSHENLVKKFKIFVQKGGYYGNKILYKNLKFFDENLAVEDFVTLLMGKKTC